jgi:hypothetical protein
VTPMEPETPVDHVWNDELDLEPTFIDDVWLEGLTRFPAALTFPISRPDGGWRQEDWPSTAQEIELQVTGFAGYGASSVVFDVTGPKGEKLVIKTARREWSFRSYIRELPPSLSRDKCQEPDRLHRKLERLIGDPMLDQIVGTYSDLYRSIVYNLHDWPAFDQIKWDSQEATQVMSFGVRAPGTISKLGRLASYPGIRPETVAWAKQTVDLLEGIKIDPVFRPEILLENPLYIWGGAILEKYFPDDTTNVSSRVRSRLTAQPDELETFVAQALALARLLNQFQSPGAESFREFCEATCDGL